MPQRISTRFYAALCLGSLEVLNWKEIDNARFIPESLFSLTKLKYLEIYQSPLCGTLSASIQELIHLTDLHLRWTHVSAPIADSLGELSGSIPASLGGLVKLKSLNPSSNALTGRIPASLGNLRRLQTLSLSRNQLPGSVPESFVNLTELDRLSLYDNRLSGGVRPVLAGLNLITLRAHKNQFSGEIPREVERMEHFTHLDLGGNALEGLIPLELCHLHALEHLSPWGDRLKADSRTMRNVFVGKAPGELSNLIGLKVLQIARGDEGVERVVPEVVEVGSAVWKLLFPL
ncbi:hypothetical protein HDU98_002975 [Podochytrium sp. JEL0797]|nr:hypothetical protein HDU98_002975 [Podochytrium sp. JEL0797]